MHSQDFQWIYCMAFILKIKILGSEKLDQLASVSGPQLIWLSSPCAMQLEMILFRRPNHTLSFLQLPHSSLKFLFLGYPGSLLPFDNYFCLIPRELGDGPVSMKVVHFCECQRLFMGVFDKRNQENHGNLTQVLCLYRKGAKARGSRYSGVYWSQVMVMSLCSRSGDKSYLQPASLN